MQGQSDYLSPIKLPHNITAIGIEFRIKQINSGATRHMQAGRRFIKTGKKPEIPKFQS
jgi:hypothetical protein